MLLKKQPFGFFFALLLCFSFKFCIASSSCEFLFEQQQYLSAAQKCQDEATLDSPYANFILGELYKNGLGVEKDISTAIAYYQKAAFNDDADAQIALGKYHAKMKNYLQSHLFYTLAVDNGSLRALRYRNKIEQNLSIKELNLSKNYVDIFKNAIDLSRKQVLIN